MVEQEKYKKMLEKVIDETENRRIQTSAELVEALVDELTNHQNAMKTTQN